MAPPVREDERNPHVAAALVEGPHESGFVPRDEVAVGAVHGVLGRKGPRPARGGAVLLVGRVHGRAQVAVAEGLAPVLVDVRQDLRELALIRARGRRGGVEGLRVLDLREDGDLGRRDVAGRLGVRRARARRAGWRARARHEGRWLVGFPGVLGGEEGEAIDGGRRARAARPRGRASPAEQGEEHRDGDERAEHRSPVPARRRAQPRSRPLTLRPGGATVGPCLAR